LTLFIVSSSSYSQVSGTIVREIDREQLDEYRRMDKYNYDKEIAPYEQSAFAKFLSNLFGFFAKGIGTFILIVLAIGLLVLIFYFISKSNTVGTVNDNELHDIQIEEFDDLQHLDLEKMLKDALASKNYRLATRILYLQILKSLNEKKLIEWKNEKTNYDYIQEIVDYKLRTKLDRVTYLYEYVWYGELTLDEYKFHSIEPEFRELEKGILK
jgi:hypothetical protein